MASKIVFWSFWPFLLLSCVQFLLNLSMEHFESVGYLMSWDYYELALLVAVFLVPALWASFAKLAKISKINWYFGKIFNKKRTWRPSAVQTRIERSASIRVFLSASAFFRRSKSTNSFGFKFFSFFEFFNFWRIFHF